MVTSKQSLIDLIAGDTPWYMHVAIWCYLSTTVILMFILPPMMGVILQQQEMGWDVVPDWNANLYSNIGWMMEFLAGASIIDLIQKLGFFIYKRSIEEKDVL
jgi:hypothetical protein